MSTQDIHNHAFKNWVTMETNFIQIGNRKINSRLMLAPMAGITDTVLRSMVRQVNKECLLVTEMLSSEALVNNPKAKKQQRKAIT